MSKVRLNLDGTSVLTIFTTYYRQKRRTITLQLGSTYPTHLGQSIKILRHQRGHLLERSVMEDDVGRHACILCELHTEFAQRFKFGLVVD